MAGSIKPVEDQNTLYRVTSAQVDLAEKEAVVAGSVERSDMVKAVDD